ncbi:MAG: precorrin-4/cobalt-precorrin-4 C11-methyltransferase [Gammaproteobacteria bacterium]|jgi:precorrin-4/cobalt-precorrin-4 C11-methyltransferase
MTVHFIGAGPGDPELITVRGQRLIASCPVCLYAGSLVPAEVVAFAPADARVIDTAPLHLEQIIEEMRVADAAGLDVARVHSGDPSLYGAISEQIRRLRELNIGFEITPGVPAFAAAAAILETELTLPDVSQTVILTRTAMRSSAMPNNEDLDTLGKSGATLAIHLSARNLRHVCETLTPHYGAQCPAVVVYRATWPDQQVIRGTLSTIREQVLAQGIRRTALVLVGPVLSHDAKFTDSKLYDAKHFHVLRSKKNSLSQQ